MDWTNEIYFFQWPEMVEQMPVLRGELLTVNHQGATEYLKEVLNKAHLFLLMDVDSKYTDLGGRSFEEPLSLPFQTCVFECLSNKTIDIECGYSLVEQRQTLRFNFIGAHELSPGKYFYFGSGIVVEPESHTQTQLFFSFDGEDQLFAQTKIIGIDRKLSQNLAKLMRARMSLCLDTLNQESTSVGRIVGRPVKLKKKIGSKKEFVKFKPITIVRPKNAQKTERTEEVFRSVDWSHRFEVRGHWRKIKGLGKSREGVYNMKEFTWVKNYIKGDDSLPVIHKIRIVDTKSSA